MQGDTYLPLEVKANWVRSTVLDMAVRARSGHVSTAFSQTELLVALYYGGLLRHDPTDPRWPERDRFILSKGQGGIGLYPILADLGYFPLSDLENFTGKDSRLGVHAEWNIPGVEVISGSLGHGLPIATGIAEVGSQEDRDWMVYCFLGDGELYEGSNWEAAFFAGHRGYRNLVCIVDWNKQCTLGFTDRDERPTDGPRIDPLGEKFASFGFEVREIDGHSYAEIFAALEGVRDRGEGRPLALIAHTVKGKGASRIEGQRLWHYRVPAGDDLEITRAELEEQRRRLASVDPSGLERAISR